MIFDLFGWEKRNRIVWVFLQKVVIVKTSGAHGNVRNSQEDSIGRTRWRKNEDFEEDGKGGDAGHQK